MNTPLPTIRRQRGVTLVESLITLAVAAVTLGAAVPSIQEARQVRRLEGAAALLETDILQARSLAVALNQSVRLSVTTATAGACYVVHTGDAGDCSCSGSGPAVCTAGAQPFRTAHYGAADGLQLNSNSGSILFDATKGTITPTATLGLASADGRSLRVVVNLMGRVRTCSPAPGLPGYKAC